MFNKSEVVWEKRQKNMGNKKKGGYFETWLGSIIKRAEIFKRPWVIHTKRVFKRVKPKWQERMQKKLRFLLSRKHGDKKELFKVKLFGRKAISKLYGGLDLKQFKYLYKNSNHSNNVGTGVDRFFARIFLRVDILLHILHFVPSLAVSKLAIQQGIVSMSFGNLYFTGQRGVKGCQEVLNIGSAVHFHHHQSELFYLIQFYRNVLKRGYIFTQVISEVSRKILVGILLPIKSLVQLINKKSFKKSFSKWVVIKKEWRFKRRFDFLYTFRYLWLISALNRKQL